MPASRLRLLPRVLPVVTGGASASALLAAGPPGAGEWRVVVGVGAVLVGGCTSLLLAAIGRARSVVETPPDPLDGRWPVPDVGTRGRRVPGSAAPRPAGDVVAQFLRDIRDAVGASEAVFWRVAEGGDGLSAAAWASAAANPALPPGGEMLRVIAWSAQEGIVQCHTSDTGPSLGAAPVRRDGRLLGALSVHAAGRLAGERDRLKPWLLRYADQIAELVELTNTRTEFERQSRHSLRLLQATQEFQALRSVEELAAALCAAAMDVSSAGRVTLVRWNPHAGMGRVETALGARAVDAGQPVDPDSHVGLACRDALPQVWDDARRLDASTPIFGAGEARRAVGSLGIVPIRGRDGVVAAAVLESEVPGAIGVRDLRSVKLLAALAAASLDTLVDFETAERDANTDPLTGLPNRRALEAQFRLTLDRADRFGETVSVIVCDVDHFKLVNDRHGHDVGDQVLRSVAATLQRGVRTVDLCARFGGEEFMLLLPHTARAGAVELAERLRRAVESRAVNVGAKELRVTASFGIAVYPASVGARDELFAAADRALYRAKADGRNCVRCADTSSSVG